MARIVVALGLLLLLKCAPVLGQGKKDVSRRMYLAVCETNYSNVKFDGCMSFSKDC